MDKELKIVRENSLVEKIVIVDGLPGNGKSLFGMSVLPALERVEIYSYSEVLESICALHFLKKLDLETASSLVQLFTDLKLSDHMSSRKVNFKPTDLTSIFYYPKPSKYLERLFQKGDKDIPNKIKIENPILNIQTHNILAFSKPIWKGLKDKVYFLEIVRHPAFMFKQIFSSAMGDLINNVRNWTVHVKFNKGVFPFYICGYEDLFSNSNQYERTVLFMYNYHQKVKSYKNQNNKIINNIITISFEKFVLSPQSHIQELCIWLNTKVTDEMDNVLQKANVPRNRIADVPDLDVYKECGGWSKSIEDFTDRDEIDMRIDTVKKNVNPKTFNLFKSLCDEYEENIWKP
jgi:hypothetical protein